MDALEWIDSDDKLIPFAIDPFGNIICFSYSGETDPSIAFAETESDSVYPVSSSFSEFLSNLSDS